DGDDRGPARLVHGQQLGRRERHVAAAGEGTVECLAAGFDPVDVEHQGSRRSDAGTRPAYSALAASVSAASARARDRSTQRTERIEISYKRYIGRARPIWEIGSGGVMNAAAARMPTMA